MFELMYLIEFDRQVSFEKGRDLIVSIYFEKGSFKVVTNILLNSASAGISYIMNHDELAEFIEAWGLQDLIHQKYLEKMEMDNRCEEVKAQYQTILNEMQNVAPKVAHIVGGIISVLLSGEKFFIDEVTYLKMVIGYDKKTVTLQTYVQASDGNYNMQTCCASHFIASLVKIVSNNPETYESYLAMKQNDIAERSVYSSMTSGMER